MKADGYDLVILVGLVLLGTGVYMLSPAWAAIVVGIILMIWGLLAVPERNHLGMFKQNGER